ncbi:MAG: sulfatase-like hydrolase/transferase [Opitutae bacterium]|nr:sulfatase-like hydrolase/transferase [Opitutae bacterium]
MKNLFSRWLGVAMVYARRIAANPRKYLPPYIAIVAIAIVAVFLTCISMPEINELSPGRLVLMACSVAWFSLFFVVLRKVPLWVRGIIFTLLFILCAFSAYLKINYNMKLDYGFIMDCVNTNSGEVASHFSFGAIFILILFVAAMFGLAWLIGKIPARLPNSKKFIALLAIVVVLAPFKGLARIYIFPVELICQTVGWVESYYDGDKQALDLLAKLDELPQEISRVPAEISHVNSAPIVVLHIGESARADHAPFNGYERNTLPNMMREYEAGNLISFPKCVSFSAKTLLSSRGLMSPSTVLDNAFRYPTFIPVLNQSGITTCGFFSYNEVFTAHEAGFFMMCRGLQKTISTPDLAETLLPGIKETISEAGKNSPQGQFYLYLGEGSHLPYTLYDFDKYAVFTPIYKESFFYKDERAVNNYDNTFVATDAFCGKFIDELRDKNAIYIFVGDHGTMLGENGFWGRDYRSKGTRHVLFFVWASDKFKAENPELWATLARNRERLGIISHDYVYNSVLHLFGLKTPYYDERADLFSDNAEPFPTEMPDAEEFGPLRFGENADTAIRWQIMKTNPL